MPSKKPNSFPVWKFMISIIWDILDTTLFRIPIFGTIADLVAIPISIYLWGTIGVAYAWEVLDLTDQLDGFIPTMTLIGIVSLLKK